MFLLTRQLTRDDNSYGRRYYRRKPPAVYNNVDCQGGRHISRDIEAWRSRNLWLLQPAATASASHAILSRLVISRRVSLGFTPLPDREEKFPVAADVDVRRNNTRVRITPTGKIIRPSDTAYRESVDRKLILYDNESREGKTVVETDTWKRLSSAALLSMLIGKPLVNESANVRAMIGDSWFFKENRARTSLPHIGRGKEKRSAGVIRAEGTHAWISSSLTLGMWRT